MPLFFQRRPRRIDAALNGTTPPPPRLWRWAAVLAAVLALHWSAARWVGGSADKASTAPPERPPVQVALLTPKPVEQAPPPVQPAAKPAAPQKPAAPAQAPAHAPVLSTPRDDPAARMTAASAAAEASATQAAAREAAQAETAAQTKAAQTAPGEKFNVPPAGELRYDTLVNGVTNQIGTIHWLNDGQHYEMVVSIPLPFVGPYVYSSKGHIDRFGLAPEQYSEQRGRRAADVTVFNRETKQLVYTRTPDSKPLADGGQDRFSVVMQLASLVRGAPDTYKPGVTRQFSVADNDSSEIWPIETVGDESVQTREGATEARHFTRLPRRDGDRRRLEIWLAPALGWLPVRILQTEPSGLQIELLWRGALKPPESAVTPGPGTPDASDESASATPQPEKP